MKKQEEEGVKGEAENMIKKEGAEMLMLCRACHVY
jgi:hypothetical protein